jgi:UPF0271 protein
MKLVLDTSAILSGKDFSHELELYSSPLVISEIKHGKMRRRLDYLMESGLKILTPDIETVGKVLDRAEKTGDISKVSETDIEVLSLAIELDAVLITDDYSMQNLATDLGIRYHGISQKGISELVIWKFRCKGCGRYWEEMKDACPICGSELKTTRK